jgi:hypothetical protein
MIYCRVALLTIAAIFGTDTAFAQEISSGDMAAAEALFAEAKSLSDAGSFTDACPKFDTSMRLMPRLGVQLNLADCYEHIGKTASAWVTFGQAAALARRLGDPRETLALQRQAALVPRLTRLCVSAAPADVERLSLMRDGMRIAPSLYGVAVPVDPGVHQIEATAPERMPWSTRVAVSGEGVVVTVVIPELKRARRPSNARFVAPVTHDTSNDRRRPAGLFWITGGLGVTGIGVGAAFGIAARSLWQEARQDCDPSNNCATAAYALIQRSRRDGNLSTVAFGIGGAALAASILLYLRGSRAPSPPAVHLAPAITSDAVGAVIGGTF